MTVELWMGQEFGTPHERKALEQFWAAMESRFGGSKEPYFVLVNFFVDDAQLDLCVLKKDAIIVIELKECLEPFKATRNDSWQTIPNEKPVGNVKRNPFMQVRDYRFKWINLLTRRQRDFLDSTKSFDNDFYQVSAFVAISPKIHPATERKDLPDSLWFRLLGLDGLDQAIADQSSQFNFSMPELSSLVAVVLDLRPASTIAEAYLNYGYFKESSYPSNHLSDHIQAIRQVIEKNNSLLVLGLSGSGKSNVLRYLVSNRTIQSSKIAFVYIDCNEFDWDDNKETLQEEICQQIIEDLTAQNIDTDTDLKEKYKKSAKRTLKSFIKNIPKHQPDHLVIIFDRSELLQRTLGRSFFDYLRALRDSNQRLSFIFSGRALDIEAFGELTDILENEPYWIGALSNDDARVVISRHLARLRISLADDQITKLISYVGRHPGLLRYACELIEKGKIDLNNAETEVIKQLLVIASVERQCREIWQDFEFTTVQNILRRVAEGESVQSSLMTKQLTHCGILEISSQGELDFTSPLFKYYVNTLRLSIVHD